MTILVHGTFGVITGSGVGLLFSCHAALDAGSFTQIGN